MKLKLKVSTTSPISVLFGGLFIAWILSLFPFDEWLINALQGLLKNPEINKSVYYFLFSSLSLVFAVINSINARPEIKAKTDNEESSSDSNYISVFSTVLGGLLTGWILTWFKFHLITIDSLKILFDMEIDTSTYYLLIIILSIVMAIINKINIDRAIARFEKYYLK